MEHIDRYDSFPIKKIHETLFILYKCSGTVERVYDAYDEHREKGSLHSFVHFSHNLYYYTIMEAVSFLEEYEKFFTINNVEDEYKERVLMVRTIAKPIHKKLRSWKDLNHYRNMVVAHGWRDEQLDNRLTTPHSRTYNIPRTYFELQLMKDLIKHLTTFISLEFQTELNEAIFMGYNIDGLVIPLKDFSNINNELQQIIDEMNTAAQAFDKTYDEFELPGYYWPEGFSKQ